MFGSLIQTLSALSMIVLVILFPIQSSYHHFAHAVEAFRLFSNVPTINDPTLKIDIIFKGLNFPTSMTFVGLNDILVLEKNDGTVQRIVNGNVASEPLINVAVANKGEKRNARNCHCQ